jgi:HSP20 family protein
MDMKTFNPWNRSNGAISQHYSPETGSFSPSYGALSRLFGEVFRDFSRPYNSSFGSTICWPHVEVRETDKEIKIMAELPGIDEKDINVTVRDGMLTLKGEKKTESNGDGNGSVYSERLHGSFERSIQLGSEINPDKVTSSFKLGVLTITFAKHSEAQSHVKRITIGRDSTTRSM